MEPKIKKAFLKGKVKNYASKLSKFKGRYVRKKLRRI